MSYVTVESRKCRNFWGPRIEMHQLLLSYVTVESGILIIKIRFRKVAVTFGAISSGPFGVLTLLTLNFYKKNQGKIKNFLLSNAYDRQFSRSIGEH